MTAPTSPSHKPWLLGTGLAVLAIALVKLAVLLGVARHYGYFVDELYLLDCGRHLDWGYVDQPPLSPLIAQAIRLTLGDSLMAIRLFAALAGAGTVLLAGAMARELGGGRRAQALAALCALLAPGPLVMEHYFSMNAFEPLFWMGCALLAIRIVRTGNGKLWLWFGALAGLGLENKHSMLIFGFGVALGLVLTRERRWFGSPWLWAGAGIAFLLFLPNLWWNIQHHFPFLELQANIRRSGRDVALPPFKFLAQETLAMLPLSAPVWLAGLWVLFFHREGKPYRTLGWAFLATAGIIMAMNPRVYYLFPAFPLLFAAGAVAWERWLEAPRMRWVFPAYAALMILMGALLAPMALPLLPPEVYIRYVAATHLQQPRIETHKLGPLPQIFADQFGWEEMAATVAGVYNALPPDIRPKTAIFGQNYGQAGAIDLFGPKYGLPPAISGHQSYFLWGPRGYSGDSMIVMDDRQERLEELFREVKKVARVSHPYSMPYQHFDVYYCQGIRMPIGDLWPKIKSWD
jgi:4-amino-4-deoxy-L-arabinose transferase-like glycosyltransferase